jgi:hypothetical protein
VTENLGIPQCEECKRRQQWLNDLGKSLSNAFSGKKESDDTPTKPA